MMKINTENIQKEIECLQKILSQYRVMDKNARENLERLGYELFWPKSEGIINCKIGSKEIKILKQMKSFGNRKFLAVGICRTSNYLYRCYVKEICN